ncbi:acid-activated periplasmic chaperone HdeB [Kosakonia oryziphila]|uniref:Acid stress chaperone HdeB n=1 Tax=Kosakonia oryziphila TaxID=1005667 RepID=A0A1C4AQK7_9ENTR|nr:acid-activated periplasmic chaperone HdeB [Kosakonia oryziphila]SCB96857.1 HdeA/HdeB family protein [Kosakonia oryziphila]
MKSMKIVFTGLALVASLFSGAISSAQAAERSPENMTCHEFINLNPKAMAPVAFWMLHDKTTYKGGDTVSLDETVNVAVPQTVEFCKKNPQAKVYEFKSKLQDLIVH